LESSATRVSADGSVIVGSSDRGPAAGYYEAFRWTAAGGMQGLGDLPGGPFASGASGVSADGSVIVGTSTISDSNKSEAFRWTSGGGMVGMGDLLPGGGFGSWAGGVSADGSVIVGGSSSASASWGEAFRWTSDGGMVGLGLLPGAFSTSATGVSGDGSVVVGEISWYPNPGGTFYWTADGGMRALWDVLLSHGVNPAADGWSSLYSVGGISADGNTIVGFGERNGQPEAFVAILAAPDVVASAFQFNDLPHRIVTTFDQDVSGSLGTDDLLIENLTTQQTIPSSDFALAYDASTNTATFSYTGNASGNTGVLPDGNYRATLNAAGITNSQGTPLTANHVFTFFFLNGDANRDGVVNLQDFNRLAANFGQSNRDFTQGDFNYDTLVNLADFNILAARFGQALAAVPVATGPFAEARDGDERRDLLEELT
jgi:probable HAF family extracellular repeat protein